VLRKDSTLSLDQDNRAAALTAQIKALATELRDKSDIPLDRITAIEEEISTKAAELDSLEAEQKQSKVDAKLAELDDRMKAFTRQTVQHKASAILAGATDSKAFGVKSVGRYSENNFLSALVERRNGDTDAQEFVKAVLGTSSATGTAVIPNNFVTGLVEQIAATNIYRDLFNVVNGVTGAGVDIPYEITAVTAALLQGAYGSNKDVRDFSFARATATLYSISQIADIGNQLLRQSNGAAEQSARRRLAKSLGIAEAQFITNGSGSSQPNGFFNAIGAFGDPAGFRTALNSESRAAALGRGISALEARGIVADRANLVIVMHPTDYWELATETLGVSGAGGWVIDPADGAASYPPVASVWGVPLRRDPWWPSAKIGTALIIERSDVELYTGQEYRIDVSSEAGSRFDQNITAFRAEEEFGFNAEPYVRTGRVQQVTGL
jgi:HK97 family phage major capsid protein